MVIFKQKVLFILSILSGSLMLGALALISLNIGSFAAPVILHFDAFRGIDAFGSNLDVWFVWGMSLIILLMNMCLAEFLFYRERILAYILISSNFLFALLTFVIAGVIVSVN